MIVKTNKGGYIEYLNIELLLVMNGTALIVIATIAQTGVGDNNTTASSRREIYVLHNIGYKRIVIRGVIHLIGFSVDLNNGDILAVGAPDYHYQNGSIL